MEKLVQVKNLVYTECQVNPRLQWFWSSHIAIVAENAQELATKHGGNMELVMLGAYLHDIGRIRDANGQEHDVVGIPMVKDILLGFGYGTIYVGVQDIVRTHRCHSDNMPRTLEEKLVATADAMSHFRGDFYLHRLWYHGPDSNFKEHIKESLKKMERDFRDKIFFPDAREKIALDYKAFKRVYSSTFVDSG